MIKGDKLAINWWYPVRVLIAFLESIKSQRRFYNYWFYCNFILISTSYISYLTLGEAARWKYSPHIPNMVITFFNRPIKPRFHVILTPGIHHKPVDSHWPGYNHCRVRSNEWQQPQGTAMSLGIVTGYLSEPTPCAIISLCQPCAAQS